MQLKLSHSKPGTVKIDVNGQELPDVTSINLHCSVAAKPRVEVEMNADALDITLDASIHITFRTFAGYDVLIETLPDGRQRVRTVSSRNL
jgi:hypothetical protein